MREDFAEYTKCVGCTTALIYCDYNCPKSGKRSKCECSLRRIIWNDLDYWDDSILVPDRIWIVDHIGITSIDDKITCKNFIE